MLRLWHNPGCARLMGRCLLPTSIIASFGAMLLALPVIRWLHLQHLVGCPFRALTGIPCPTCGYSRAFDLVQAGHWSAALQFQPFVLAIVALSGVAAIWAAISIWKKQPLALPRSLVGGIWALLAMSWVWNLYHHL